MKEIKQLKHHIPHLNDYRHAFRRTITDSHISICNENYVTIEGFYFSDWINARSHFNNRSDTFFDKLSIDEVNNSIVSLTYNL